MLAILDVFTVERPVATVNEIAAAIEVPRVTAYRYLKTLCDAGLLLRLGNADFCLGPRIVQLDRQIQLSDPLIALSRSAVSECLSAAPWDALLLCSFARDMVLCVHEELRAGSEVRLKRPRGMPFPMFRGPASQIILAHLPIARIRELYVQAIEKADDSPSVLGANLDEVRKSLRAMKRRGYAMSRNEFRTGLLGVAAPIHDGSGRIVGSIAGVKAQSQLPEGDHPLVRSVVDCAAAITRKFSA